MNTRYIGILLCSVLPMAVGGQVPSGSGKDRAESVPHAVYSDNVVEGEPYQATFEGHERIFHPDGQVTTSVMCGRIYRDREGRVRRDTYGFAPCDSLAQPLEAPIVMINDYVQSSDAAYILDPARKIFWRLSFGFGKVTPRHKQTWGFQSLQERQDVPEPVQLEGLKCRKVLIKTEDGEAGTVWLCDERGVVVRQEVGPRVTWQLTHILGGEPDPALFKVPPDYQDETGKEKPSIEIPQ